jgi:hypothetical protein
MGELRAVTITPTPDIRKTLFNISLSVYENTRGRDNAVRIAIHNGLDGPGIKSHCWRDFPHPSRPALRPTHSPIQWEPGLFPGVKRPGRGVEHPPHLVPRLKKE